MIGWGTIGRAVGSAADGRLGEPSLPKRAVTFLANWPTHQRVNLPAVHFFGFIFDAQAQSPAQPPSLRRRAAASQRRMSQPAATPTIAPTMTASRVMRCG